MPLIRAGLTRWGGLGFFVDMKKVYSDMLKNPEWQRKRLAVMSRDDFSCRVCSDRKSTLSVHHKTYLKGGKPWESLDADLVTLCEKCHSKLHSTPSPKTADEWIRWHGMRATLANDSEELLRAIEEMTEKSSEIIDAMYSEIDRHRRRFYVLIEKEMKGKLK